MKATNKLIVFMLLTLISITGRQAISQTDEVNNEPEKLFNNLERRLLAAESLRLRFSVSSEGYVESEQVGVLTILPDGKIILYSSGLFAGQTVDLLLETDADHYSYGNQSARESEATPQYLKESLLIGLTRMGILHNLARLTTAAPPDHADGGVKDWVKVNTIAFTDKRTTEITFNITVAGTPAASATLLFNTRDLPVIRHQTVKFPEGEMRVIENYIWEDLIDIQEGNSDNELILSVVKDSSQVNTELIPEDHPENLDREDQDYRLIVRVPPIYPREALKDSIQGYAIVQFDITEKGTTRNLSIVESSPPGHFEKTSIQAVEKFRYQPRAVDGKPVVVTGVRHKVEYSLEP